MSSPPNAARPIWAKIGIVKSAAGDAVLTSLWVFSMSLPKVFTGIVAANLGVQTIPFAGLFITINFITRMVFIFSLIGSQFGGASFNPTSAVSFCAVGLKPDTSLLSMAI